MSNRSETEIVGSTGGPPMLLNNMISGKQDWDCELALERRALILVSERDRLNAELAWINKHMQAHDDIDWARRDQSTSTITADLESGEDWNIPNDRDEASIRVWYIIGSVVIVGIILIIVIAATKCCSI